MNSLKHGMTARVIVLPHEDSVEYHEIRAGLIESYAPANAHGSMLVDQIAAGYWRTLRARRFETALLAEGARTYKDNHGKSMEPNAGYDDAVCAVWMVQMEEAKLRNYYRYDGSIERQYYRAIATLEKTQAARFRREEQVERQLERTLRNAHPDTLAAPSPEPPPPTEVSENGIGSVQSQPRHRPHPHLQGEKGFNSGLDRQAGKDNILASSGSTKRPSPPCPAVPATAC